jgi:hypothetical protein
LLFLLLAVPLLLAMPLAPEVPLVPAAPVGEVVPTVAMTLLLLDVFEAVFAPAVEPVVEEGLFLPLCCRPEWVVRAMLLVMCAPVLVLLAVVCVDVAVVAAAAVAALDEFAVLGFAVVPAPLVPG